MALFCYTPIMKSVPPSLRFWFKIHFLADMLFGLPLLLAPEWIMSLFQLPLESSITARLLGAALIGIGGNSLLMNKKSAQTYRAMLNLKILWSGAAILALVIEIYNGASPLLWWVLGIFIGFAGLWNFYRWTK